MRVTRIYQNNEINVEDIFQLDSRGHKHIFTVLRSKPGDRVILFNGSGYEFTGIVESINKKYTMIRITDSFPKHSESPLKIHLAQAISKSDSMDFAIQKSTELGVSDITPIQTDFCGFKLSAERLGKKFQHWQQVAISACEQCQRSTIPKVHQPTHFNDWLKNTNADLKLVFDTHGDYHKSLQPSASAKPLSIALIIGPEGGFSEKELKAAKEYAYQETSLGPRILRTETAPIAAISILQFLWGDMGVKDKH